MIISTKNKTNRKIVYICENCSEPIREGDGYYLVGQNFYCENCIERNYFVAYPEYEEEEE